MRGEFYKRGTANPFGSTAIAPKGVQRRPGRYVQATTDPTTFALTYGVLFA